MAKRFPVLRLHNDKALNWPGIAIWLAALLAITGTTWAVLANGGQSLPAPAAGTVRIPLSYSSEGRPRVEADPVHFTRADGTIVVIGLDDGTYNENGMLVFQARTATGPNDTLLYDRASDGDNGYSPASAQVGRPLVLDGVKITVVANWTRPKYRSDALDVQLADAPATGTAAPTTLTLTGPTATATAHDPAGDPVTITVTDNGIQYPTDKKPTPGIQVELAHQPPQPEFLHPAGTDMWAGDVFKANGLQITLTALTPPTGTTPGSATLTILPKW